MGVFPYGSGEFVNQSVAITHSCFGMFSFTGSSKETSLAAARGVGVMTEDLTGTQCTNLLAESIGRRLANALTMLCDMLAVLHLDTHAGIDIGQTAGDCRGDKTAILIR